MLTQAERRSRLNDKTVSVTTCLIHESFELSSEQVEHLDPGKYV